MREIAEHLTAPMPAPGNAHPFEDSSLAVHMSDIEAASHGNHPDFARPQYELTIEPGRSDHHYLRDLWYYRELFHVLAWRDISVRYKQTVIGVAWALIRPFLTMVVFTIIFGRIANLPSQGVPYALLVYAGMLPWTFFSTALADSSNSLVSNTNLISKVYFPRMIVPIAAIMVAIVDLLIGLALLAVLMVWFAYAPPIQIVLLPIFIVMAFLASLGPALWITAMNVKYRDFRYVIPFVVQFGLYISPVGFSSKIIPEQWQTLYALNPMVGIIEGFRWCILGGDHRLSATSLCIGAVVIVVTLWLGIRRFRKTEKSFADLI
jgi:lipopolysaccharide transport system permease protein